MIRTTKLGSPSAIALLVLGCSGSETNEEMEPTSDGPEQSSMPAAYRECHVLSSEEVNPSLPLNWYAQRSEDIGGLPSAQFWGESPGSQTMLPELLAALEGDREAPLSWFDDDAGIPHETVVTMRLTLAADEAAYVTFGLDPDNGLPVSPLCVDRLVVPASMEFRTSDGAFDEELTGETVFVSRLGASFEGSMRLGDFRGTFSAFRWYQQTPSSMSPLRLETAFLPHIWGRGVGPLSSVTFGKP